MINLLKFLSIYFIIVISILAFYLNVSNEKQEQLAFTKSELRGIAYLENIYYLGINVALHQGNISFESDSKEVDKSRKKINQYIDLIHKQQKEFPEFKNNEFNLKLENLKKFSNSNDFYLFLDYLNHENYRIGDVSKLLFENDREAYFLSSLITHYMPEYLISTIISHNIVEELMRKGSVNNTKKDIFTEQNKLMYLSSKEIYGIIKLLSEYDDAKILSVTIEEIMLKLELLSQTNNSIVSFQNNLKEANKYIVITHQLLELSYKLNNSNIRILESKLTNRQVSLEDTIFAYESSLIFILVLISLVLFYFYRSFTRTIKQDTEIKSINKTLDNLVVFSKTDLDGKITYVSTALERLSGFSRVELIGYSHNIFKHEDMDKAIFEDLWKTILAKKVWIGEIKNKAKDGSVYWVKATISPEIENNKIIGFNAHRENITDKKELELEKLKTQEALKFKAMFLSNMSHEIRTPLNGIIGLTSVALKTKLDKKQKHLMNNIQTSSNILLGVVNDILDISKIESGKMTIEKTDFNLRTLINNIESILSEKVQEQGIKFNVNYNELINSSFIGDSLRISQVLTNLLNNAIKFTSQGEVNLNIKNLNNNLIRFEVQDTGIGLKKEQLKTLFEEFTQADMSTSRKYGGTGLGLSISKNLVELMGGEISVKSEFTKGSTFSFELPLEVSLDVKYIDENDAIELKRLEDKLNSLDDISILVAEDNKMNQMVLSMLLEDSKLNLDFASDGNIAVEKFKQNNYNLILMDIQMPNLNGYDATTAIRSINSDIPIVGLSANAMHEDRKKALDVGMTDYLAKPIDVKKLYKTLSKYLAKN